MEDSDNKLEEPRNLEKPSPNRRQVVRFWPDYARRSEDDNKSAAMRRFDILLNSGLISDPLEEYILEWKTGKRLNAPAPFKVVPSDFLRQAQRRPPSKRQATASAFSQWIYSLYSNTYGTDEDRERGKAMEEEILELRRRAVCSIDNDFLGNICPDWALIHNGLHLSGGKEIRYFQIDDLQVGGEPLKASPDLIFHNAASSEVIIVEIKYSRMPIPTNLWPNVWAQLWCYSQIEVAKRASKVTVIGEIWGESWVKNYGRGKFEPRQYSVLYLRASVRRDPRAPAYDRFFRGLFEIYRGNN